MFERDGTVIMYGEKPRTPLYALHVDPEKGLNSVKFVPIV